MSFTWPDGSKHTISWGQHQADIARNASAAAAIQNQNQGAVRAAMAAHGTPPQAGPTAATAAAPTPDVAPQPYDPALAASQLGAGFNISLANSEAGYQAGQTAYGTGYNADGTLNTSNPYSQAALLQTTFQQHQLGNTNSLAAQGQLYSGALVNAQNANDRDYSIGSNQLQNQAANTYHGLGVNQLTAYGQNAGGTSSDAFNSLLHSVYGGS